MKGNVTSYKVDDIVIHAYTRNEEGHMIQMVVKGSLHSTLHIAPIISEGYTVMDRGVSMRFPDTVTGHSVGIEGIFQEVEMRNLSV